MWCHQNDLSSTHLGNQSKFHYDLKAATHGNLNKALHKRVCENEKFRCMLKSCKYTAPFKDMLDHLRKSHSDAYVVYRCKMMEKYGIMEMECPDCKFQFLTTYSYEHHRKNKRCHVYKGKISSKLSWLRTLHRGDPFEIGESATVK